MEKEEYPAPTLKGVIIFCVLILFIFISGKLAVSHIQQYQNGKALQEMKTQKSIWLQEMKKEAIESLHPVDINLSMDSRALSNVYSNGLGMTLYDDKGEEYSVRCPFVLQSSTGNLPISNVKVYFREGSWFIPSNLLSYVKKEDVVKHIQTCAPILLKEFLRIDNIKTSNLDSWK